MVHILHKWKYITYSCRYCVICKQPNILKPGWEGMPYWSEATYDEFLREYLDSKKWSAEISSSEKRSEIELRDMLPEMF
jgi:hypothetical protein